jgi:hypothetical protein
MSVSSGKFHSMRLSGGGGGGGGDRQRAGFCCCGFLPCLNIFCRHFSPVLSSRAPERHRARDAAAAASRSPRGGETFGPGPGGTYCAILNNSKKHIGNISDDSSLSLSLSLISLTVLSKQVSCVAFLLGGSKNSSFFFLFFYSRAEGVVV